MRFRPQRAVGQWLLRALGGSPQVTELEWDDLVRPVFTVGGYLPGLVSAPRREQWAFTLNLPASAGDRGRGLVWAATSTFATEDPRTAAGVWILKFAMSHAAGVLTNPPTLRFGVPGVAIVDPGVAAVGLSPEMVTLWGQDFDVTGQLGSVAGERSPRAQCSGSQEASAQGGAINYPALLSSDRGSEYTGPPIYVPPGFRFVWECSTENLAVALGVIYIEAEEPPLETPLP